MRIAITGGNGRIGQAVVELALTQGHTVVNIDRIKGDADLSGVTHFQLDTTDYDSFKKVLDGCEALIHLAAIPGPGYHPDHIVHNNNVVSSYNALRAAAELGINRVCQASSINAIGGAYSRLPHYDYFPLDEEHPTYNEDPYSLSKWICEIQADSFVRRYENMKIASLRIHGVAAERIDSAKWQDSATDIVVKHLWGYVRRDSTARACLLGVTADFSGHEAFYIVASDTVMNIASLELKEQFYPNVSVQGDLSENKSFFDCQKAKRLLGWQHDTDSK
ncbi:MAG: NAD(P)-dependent oxidoreductase [Anaerolineales bacterium]|uniref:NAD(P)-dependent oxidoreductase n=1 Tax=Candidatus Desulfolinea nitratireducens TaxID=2841698 RepID=A0A8J6TIU0_9CHLR|nr:NAD(P)-dependent oxidoreductase [Candidatus Desulfolinea nitratireducens]